jgi:hypothetical protein
MNISGAPWFTIGWLIALIVLLLAIVFMAIGQLDYKLGGLIGGVALARLVP